MRLAANRPGADGLHCGRVAGSHPARRCASSPPSRTPCARPTGT